MGFGPVGHMKEEEAYQVLSILQKITKKNKELICLERLNHFASVLHVDVLLQNEL